MKNFRIYFFFFLLPVFASCQKEVSPPNIVFIMADDLGYAEVGCYGQQRIETPNIDKLARNGMKFTQFYSGAPVCAPARCVLLTGKHTGHAYVRGNDEWRERGEVWDFAKAVEDPGLEGQRPMPDSILTVAELLQTAGYTTACVGKWGLGAPYTEGAPNNQGFDFFFGYNCQRQAHTYYPKHLWRNEEKVWLTNDLVVPGTKLEIGADPLNEDSYSNYSLDEYAPDLMFEETINFLEENHNNPFFLYFATPIPHVPLQAPDSLIKYYRNKFGEEDPYLGDQGYFPTRAPRATYAAMVTYLDNQIGQIIKKLKELGVYDNTIIFFTSDNGPTYAGGADSQFFDSAAPFSSDQGRGKGSVYEGGIRVPFIVQWPGRIAGSSKSDHLSAFYDMMPTFCELAGIDIPGDIDGLSIVPLLTNDPEQDNHAFLYWEFPAYGGQQAVRMDNWKGVRKNMFDGNLEIELYDLSSDIEEMNNLAGENPEIVDKIQNIMIEQHRASDIGRFKFEVLGDQ
jgi:arylsulfatase